ncbi:hypothetical protein ACNOYE_22455 [Nannocystaceae bacterium ST9]
MSDRSRAELAVRRFADNPFHVLGLRPDCGRAEVEREGQKLLAMLELGLSAARRYNSPLGEHERSAEQVREAMAELRDPERRLIHELWAGLAPTPADAPTDAASSAATDAPGSSGPRFAGFALLGFLATRGSP